MNFRQILLVMILVLTSCFLCFSLFGQPTTNGLLAYFPLNGNTNNAGPANITATAVNTGYTTNNANVANNALQFAGNLNSYIDFVDNGNLDFSGTNNFTISFSFFFNGSSTSGLLDNCLNYGGWGIWLWSTVAGTWNLQFNYKNNSVGSAAATAFTTGVWHHVAAVRNNGTISLYIDGIFRLSSTEGTATPTYPLNMNAGAMTFGGFSPPRYNPFGGKIDEIRIYNRALSAGEIGILVPFSLPLKLGEFTAVRKPTGIRLNWETLTEQNTSHFEIEKSTDGANWNSIGRVSAAGNSADKRSYSFTDNSPGTGVVFYRLKMVDNDSAFTYSRVITLKNESQFTSLQLFPNPVTDNLQVQIPSSGKLDAVIWIIDAGGKTVHSRTLQLSEGQNTASIPVLHLTAGIYYLIIDDGKRKHTKSFIKN